MGFRMVAYAIYFNILGYSPVRIGFLLSIATFMSAIHHITFGYLCDKYGRKPFLILGTVFATLRMVIYTFFTGFWMLVLAQSLGAMGEGIGAGQPVVSGYITDKTDIKSRAEVYSTLAITNAISTTIGSALGGLPQLIVSNYSLDIIQAHQVIWGVSAVISGLSVLLLFPIKEAEIKNEVESSKPRKGIRNWGVIAKFSLVRSSSGLGWGMIGSLMTLYFYQRFGVGSEILGPIYAFSRFLSIFSYMLVPRFVRAFGDINTLIASRLLSGLVTVAFAAAHSYPLAVTFLILNRIVLMFSMPIRQNFASGMVDPDETATAIGISNSARMGVRSVAPTLAGYMFEAVSLSMPFHIGAALLALNGGLFWVFFRDKNTK
jgi:predicted MFS family arabinose efflux permease